MRRARDFTDWSIPSRCRLRRRHQTIPRDAQARFFAVEISCFSLIELANQLKDLLRTLLVVTISISTTRMASENYGYMVPVKAALDSSLAFLAKSFSQFSEIRFNAVAPACCKNFGVGRHSRLRRCIPVCRTSHSAKMPPSSPTRRPVLRFFS